MNYGCRLLADLLCIHLSTCPHTLGVSGLGVSGQASTDNYRDVRLERLITCKGYLSYSGVVIKAIARTGHPLTATRTGERILHELEGYLSHSGVVIWLLPQPGQFTHSTTTSRCSNT